jgi:hypothetical protein
MNISKWKHINGAHGLTLAPRQLSAGGKAIAREWCSPWQPDESGLHETRRHVGRSLEGFHPGIEVCYRAGMGRIEWGEAQSTAETAYAMSAELENNRRDEVRACIDGRIRPMESGRCVYTHLSTGVGDALLALHEIVARIESDPSENWPKHNADFERAVVELSQSITALWVRHGQR